MAFKQKSGSPFQRNFGVGKSPAKQTSPMKGTGNPPHPGNPEVYETTKKHNIKHNAGSTHPSDKDFIMMDNEEESALEMKKSGFKMKSDSPMKRNFGVGDTPSPMKVAAPGIKPVFTDEDGNITVGEAFSSEAAKKHVEEGGRVMKTGEDAVIDNIADLNEALIEDPSLEGLQEAYEDPSNLYNVPEVKKGEKEDTERHGQYISQTTGKGEGSDYAKWAEMVGPELEAADKEIQDYLNTHGSKEGMPENLLTAMKEIQNKEIEMLEKTGGQSENLIRHGYKSGEFGDVREQEEGEELVNVGRIEGGTPDEFGLQLETESAQATVPADVGFTKEYKDIEVGPGGVARESGTAAAAEEERLAKIEEAKKLEAEKLEKEKLENERLAKEKLETERLAKEKIKEEKANTLKEWRASKPSPYDFSGENAANEWKDATNKWEASKPS